MRLGLLSLLPGTMVVLTEAAWITVVYAAIDVALGSGDLRLGFWVFVVGAAIGRGLAARRATGLLVLAVLVGGALGWVIDAGVLAVPGDPFTVDALVHHPGGWLLGVAVWRGGRGLRADVAGAAPILTAGLFGLAIPWVAGAGSRAADAFVVVAVPATMVFAAAGLLAVGLARLESLGDDVGIDWRENRSWFALLVGVVVLMLLIGIPAAYLMGASLDALAETVFGPVTAVRDAAAGAVAPIVARLQQAGPASPPSGGLVASDPRWTEWFLNLVAIGIALVVIGLLVVLVRVRRAEPPIPEDELVVEQHWFVIALPSVAIARPNLSRLRRRTLHRPPATASEAYLSVLARLAADEYAARSAAESPQRHARRLREAGHRNAALDRLAADFALERYGGRTLTPRETRRAIERATRR